MLIRIKNYIFINIEEVLILWISLGILYTVILKNVPKLVYYVLELFPLNLVYIVLNSYKCKVDPNSYNFG
jgi:hypothetical protein